MAVVFRFASVTQGLTSPTQTIVSSSQNATEHAQALASALIDQLYQLNVSRGRGTVA